MVTELDEVGRMGKLLKYPETIEYDPHKSLEVNDV